MSFVVPDRPDDQLATALNVSVPHRRHLHAVGRLADFVHHAARDDRAARQAELDFVDRLSVTDFERLAGLEGTRLSVLQLDEAALRRGQLVSSGRQLSDLERAFVIRRGQAVFAKLRRGGAHLSLA